MKTTLNPLLLTAIALATGAGFAEAQSPPVAVQTPPSNTVSAANHPVVRDALNTLDIWLQGQRYHHDLPGFSVGIVHDQELLWSKGYGFADLTNRIPATDETLYRVASITKTFTAAAVVQLAERGRFSLEDPVDRHLPWFTPLGAEAASPLRVWHLLSHTAGLNRESPGADWDTLTGPSMSEIRAAASTNALSFPPQTRLKYSNYGFDIAGELVNQVAGQRYEDYVRSHILLPLGMTNSRFLNGNETPPGLAVAYGRRLPGQPRSIERQADMRDIASVGSLASNVRDLARWAAFQLRDSDADPGPVLTGRSIREMHRPRFLVSDWSQGWGLGWRLTRGEKRATIDHGGSLPGYKSRLLIRPDRKLAVIVLFNADDGPRELAEKIMKLITAAIEKATTPDETILTAAGLAQFEGHYRDRSGEFMHVLVVGGKLRLLDPETDDPEQATLTLKQTGAMTFVTEARDTAITGGVASVVEFHRDAGGKILSLTTEHGAYRYHRMD